VICRDGSGIEAKELLAAVVMPAGAAVQVAGDEDAVALVELASTYFVAGDKVKAKEYARKAVEAAAGESAALKQAFEKEAKMLDDGKKALLDPREVRGEVILQQTRCDGVP
jgi:hypothetical protein